MTAAAERAETSPIAQQRAETREHEAGQDEDQVALHPAEPDMADRLAADDGKAADDDDRAEQARERNALPEQGGREEQAAQGRAGRLDDAAMPQWHEQESDIADERHHRPAQHHQHQSAAPSDAAEIAEAGANNERQERKARPKEAVHQQVRRREADLQAVPCRHEAERPEQRGADTACDTEEGRPRI